MTGQLIDALTGNHIWAERYDRKLEDIFSMQEELTTSIVKALALNTLAHAKYLNSFHMTTPNVDEAWTESVAASSRAIDLDPYDCRAYVYRGWVLMFAKGRDRWDEALRDLRRAHHLNPNDVEALSRLGWAETAADDFECGLDHLHQALRTNPRDPVQQGTHHRLAI